MSGIAKINKLTAVPRDARAAAMSIASAPVSWGIMGSVAPSSEYSYSRVLQAGKYPVHLMSTVGAADGFGAGFLYGLIRGLSLDACLRYGNAVAAIVRRRASCSDAMPYLNELNEFLALNTRSGTQEASVEAPRRTESP